MLVWSVTRSSNFLSSIFTFQRHKLSTLISLIYLVHLSIKDQKILSALFLCCHDSKNVRLFLVNIPRDYLGICVLQFKIRLYQFNELKLSNSRATSIKALHSIIYLNIHYHLLIRIIECKTRRNSLTQIGILYTDDKLNATHFNCVTNQ